MAILLFWRYLCIRRIEEKWDRPSVRALLPLVVYSLLLLQFLFSCTDSESDFSYRWAPPLIQHAQSAKKAINKIRLVPTVRDIPQKLEPLMLIDDTGWRSTVRLVHQGLKKRAQSIVFFKRLFGLKSGFMLSIVSQPVCCREQWCNVL